MTWGDDWQTRADAGRDLGGRHLGRRPVKPECPECHSTAVTARSDPAGRGATMRSKCCDACGYLFDLELDR